VTLVMNTEDISRFIWYLLYTVWVYQTVWMCLYLQYITLQLFKVA